MRVSSIALSIFALLPPLLSGATPAFHLSWPTPNPAFAKGMGYSAFLQKTGPDKAFSSGAFGCVRNNGYKFHEGLDLASLKLLSVALFIFVTSPTATHAIARAAKRNQVPWWVKENGS